MSKQLKKDIVIPAGTVFLSAPRKTVRFGDGHYQHVVGLTDNSSGDFTYCVDKDDPKLADWFEEVE